MDTVRFISLIIQDMILASIPAAGFAMVFNVPKKALKWCALLGAIGHGSRFVIMNMGVSIECATFLSACIVGYIGILWSKWYLAHPKIFTVAAIIPMVPGIAAYDAMIAVVRLSHYQYSDSQLIVLVTHFLKASSIVAALALGLSLPGLINTHKKQKRLSN